MLPKYTIKCRLAGDVNPTISERRNDLLRMFIPKLRTARDFNDLVFLELREFIMNELRAASSVVRIPLPTVVATGVDRKRAAGVVYSASVFFSFLDELDASSSVVGGDFSSL